MLRIAVCDDDSTICFQLEDYLERIRKETQRNLQVEVFFDGERLKEQLLSGEKYDLLFLDIELGSLLGIDIATIIRKELKLEEVYIVYISGKNNYTESLFKTRPLDFLTKPIEYKEFKQVFDTFVNLNYRNQSYYEFKGNGTFRKVYFKDIYYFESDDKKIKIHTVNEGIIEYYGKLSEVNNKLNSDFIAIHKSFIVNYNMIENLSYDSAQLVNGETLAISQSRRKTVRDLVVALREEYYD